MSSRPAANFDPLARCYAPLEWLSFGSALSRRRTRFLGDPRLAGTTHALVLGDGDGRFTAALLERYPSLRVTALDSSAAMLAALERRVALRTPRARLELHCADIRTWLPPRAGYDLVATHRAEPWVDGAALRRAAAQPSASVPDRERAARRCGGLRAASLD